MERTNGHGGKADQSEHFVPARVWGGAALLSLGRIWATMCTAVVLMVLSRHLPGEEFGRYTFYLALFLVRGRTRTDSRSPNLERTKR